MGIPSFLLANTLNSSVAQRLVRKLCDNCKAETTVNLADLPSTFDPQRAPKKHHISVGCDQCHFTGYKGRQALYEIIPIQGILAEKIKNQDFNVQGILTENGIKSLSERALELWSSGVTTLEEIYSLLIE